MFCAKHFINPLISPSELVTRRCPLHRLGNPVSQSLDNLLKVRDITLPTKVRLVKALFFPVVMYGCESWTRVGRFGRMALKHVKYHVENELPVQVRCMRQGAQGWCTGMTLWDGMGREMEEGSGWGTHVQPWLIHVNVWQKPLQYCEVASN